jgi:hypothetical protein
MNPMIEHLRQCADAGALRAALLMVCSRHGAVMRLDILPANHGSRSQALCFLRMATTDQEDALIAQLGLGRFGGDVVVIVELHRRWADPGLALFSPTESATRLYPASHAQHPPGFGHSP